MAVQDGLDQLALAGAEALDAEQLVQRPVRVGARARPAPAGAARGRAGRGSRRLPWAAGHYPQARRAPATRGPPETEPAAEAACRAELARGCSTRTSRSSPAGCRRSSATELLAVYAGGSYALGAYEHGPQRRRRHRGRRGPARRRDEAAARRRAPPRGAPVPRASAWSSCVYPRATTAGRRRRTRLRAQPQHRREHRLPRRLRTRRHRGLLVRDRPLDPARARDPAARPAARGAARGDPARRRSLPVLEESIRWHRGDDIAQRPSSTSPAAAHFLATGHWISKPEARRRLDDVEGAP